MESNWTSGPTPEPRSGALEVEFVQTLEDHIAFNIYHAECQPWWERHRDWWLGCILMAGCVFLAEFMYFDFLASPDNPFNSDSRFRFAGTILTLMTFEGFWTAFALALWRWRLARQVKRFLARPENRRLLGWQLWAIRPEGLTIRTEDNENTIRWTAIARIAQSDDHAFLYETSHTANALPRSAFPSVIDFLSFVGLARSYWQAARDEQAAGDAAAPNTGIRHDSAPGKADRGPMQP